MGKRPTLEWENDDVGFEVSFSADHINLTCDAVPEGCWIPNEDWPEVRDFIDKELGVEPKASRTLERLLDFLEDVEEEGD